MVWRRPWRQPRGDGQRARRVDAPRGQPAPGRRDWAGVATPGGERRGHEDRYHSRQRDTKGEIGVARTMTAAKYSRPGRDAHTAAQRRGRRAADLTSSSARSSGATPTRLTVTGRS
jgi:hypothetical protein